MNEAYPLYSDAWWLAVLGILLSIGIVPLILFVANIYRFGYDLLLRYRWSRWSLAERAGYILNEEITNSPVRTESKQGVVVARLDQGEEEADRPALDLTTRKKLV